MGEERPDRLVPEFNLWEFNLQQANGGLPNGAGGEANNHNLNPDPQLIGGNDLQDGALAAGNRVIANAFFCSMPMCHQFFHFQLELENHLFRFHGLQGEEFRMQVALSVRARDIIRGIINQ